MTQVANKTNGNKLTAIINDTPSTESKPVKKRPAIKDKEEWDKKPVIIFDKPTRFWSEGSISMREEEFKIIMLPHLRIIHEETIGYYVSEDDETYDKTYDAIEVTIYGSDGIRTNKDTGKQQQSTYALYVRYDNLLWSARSIIDAIKIVERIRSGRLLRQQQYQAWLKEYNAKRRAKAKRKAR